MPGADAVLDQHEDLAELARNAFLGLSVVIVLVSVTVWRLGDRLPRPLVSWACALYLVAHLLGVAVLANAAHEGGRLVHEFGVRTGSATASSGTQPMAPPARTETGHRDDD